MTFLGLRLPAVKGDFGAVLSFFYIAIPSALLLTFFGAPAAAGFVSGARMTALLWTIACFCIGTTAGFLFGIPKILQNFADSRPKEGASGGANLSGTYGQQVNTNLTEISDWLTKIIVGLGLIHLKEIPPFIRAKASVLAASLMAEKGSGDYLAFAVALTIAFVILGFLFGYICTRMHLAAAFARADLRPSTAARERPLNLLALPSRF